MDPNENLAEQIRLAGRIAGQQSGHVRPHVRPLDAIRLAELVMALDEWLSNGGFLPQNWYRNADT